MGALLLKMGSGDLSTKNEIFDSYYSILNELYLVKFLEAISLLIKQAIRPAKMLKICVTLFKNLKLDFYVNFRNDR